MSPEMREKLNRHSCSSAIEHIEKLEQQHIEGYAAKEVLFWWASQLSNAPNNELKAVIREGYSKIINLTNMISKPSVLAEYLADAFQNAEVPRAGKAGCIGDFGFTVENANCCPQCWHEKDDKCELCDGESDENGMGDLEVQVPWDLQKKIWLRMNKVYASQLRQQAKNGE